MPVDINFKAFKLDELDEQKQIRVINKVRDLEEEVIFEDLFKKWTLPVDIFFSSNSITHLLNHKVNSNIVLNESKPFEEDVPIYFSCDKGAKELISAVDAKHMISNFERDYKDVLDIYYPHEKSDMKEISSLFTGSIIDYINADRKTLSTLSGLLNVALEDWNIGLRTAYEQSYVSSITDFIENNNILFSENGDVIEPKPYYEITNENKLGM